MTAMRRALDEHHFDWMRTVLRMGSKMGHKQGAVLASPRRGHRCGRRSELEGALRDAGLGEWAPGSRSWRGTALFWSRDRSRRERTRRWVRAASAASPTCRRMSTGPQAAIHEGMGRNPAGPMPGRVLLGRHHWLHRLFRTQRWTQLWRGGSARDKPKTTSAIAPGRSASLPRLTLPSFMPCTPWMVSRLPDGCCFSAIPSTGRGAKGRIRRGCAPSSPSCRPSAWSGDALRRSSMRPRQGHLMPRGYVFKPRALRPTAWLLPPPWGSREFLRLQAEAPGAWAHEADVFSAYQQFWRDLFRRQPQTFRPAAT